MSFTPELFSAPVLERLEAQGRHELASVPYFDGLLAGEPEALVKSFAAVPELHDPVRGRVKGARAFEAFVPKRARGSGGTTPRSRTSSTSSPSDAASRR